MAGLYGTTPTDSGSRIAGPSTLRRVGLLFAFLIVIVPGLLAGCSARPTPTPAPTRSIVKPTPTTTARTSVPSVVPAPLTPTVTPGSKATAIPLATVPPPVATAVPVPIGQGGVGFGMTMHFMWYDFERATRELDELQAAGLTVVRFDVGWRWIEPTTKGSYDIPTLTKLDSLLNEMDARGIRPIIAVIETPAWARPEETGIFTPPTDHQDYADVMGVLARRYADRPNMVWEIWNEPNLKEFWVPAPDAAAYTDMLRRAYTAIKAADPDATVLGGSIVFNDLKFLRAMYAAGARGTFDGLAIHPYVPGRSPDDRRDPFSNFGAVEDMKAIMTANGDPSKTIWITEMGWELDLITDETRARYLTRAVQLVRGWPYVKTFCVYTLSQDIGPDAERFGLLDPQGVPSRSWLSYIGAAGGR